MAKFQKNWVDDKPQEHIPKKCKSCKVVLTSHNSAEGASRCDPCADKIAQQKLESQQKLQQDTKDFKDSKINKNKFQPATTKRVQNVAKNLTNLQVRLASLIYVLLGKPIDTYSPQVAFGWAKTAEILNKMLISNDIYINKRDSIIDAQKEIDSLEKLSTHELLQLAQKIADKETGVN